MAPTLGTAPRPVVPHEMREIRRRQRGNRADPPSRAHRGPESVIAFDLASDAEVAFVLATSPRHADARALGALEPTIQPRATDNIPQMQALITELIARNHAYNASGDSAYSNEDGAIKSPALD